MHPHARWHVTTHVMWQGAWDSVRFVHVGQFARVVKGVDLRSTAGNCAWVRTPQLTFAMLEVFMVLPSCERKNMKSMLVSIRGGRPKQCDATRYGKLRGSIP